MERPKPNKLVLVLVALVHAGVTALTWRDIRQRPAEQIRGSKRLWRVLSVLNTGNSLLYWTLGRRRPRGSPAGTS